MNWIPRSTAVLTIFAVIFHSSFLSLAANGATIEGVVKIPCDPSRVSDVAIVQIRPVVEGAVTSVAVDPSNGTFVGSGLAEGEYELFAIGTDGKPLSPEPQKLLLKDGPNTVILSMQPPGCGEQDSDFDGVADSLDSCPDSPRGTAVGTDGCALPGKAKSGRPLKDWQVSLIYFGVVGGVILALDDDDEEPATPF